MKNFENILTNEGIEANSGYWVDHFTLSKPSWSIMVDKILPFFYLGPHMTASTICKIIKFSKYLNRANNIKANIYYRTFMNNP